MDWESKHQSTNPQVKQDCGQAFFHGHKKKSASPTQAEARTNGTKDLRESTVQDEPMVDSEVPIEDQELEAVLESNDPPLLVLE
jgi:hypothetical protein